MQSHVLKEYFQHQRQPCNAYVAGFRHKHPSYSLEHLQWFIRNALDPLLQQLEQGSHTHLSIICQAGFEHGVELVSHNWLNDDVKRSLITQCWQALLPQFASLLITSRGELFTLVTNVLCKLWSQGEAAARKWLTLMATISTDITSLNEFQYSGLVCAWVSGLPQYRHTALTLIDQLAPQTRSRLFPAENPETILLTLAASPWPASSDNDCQLQYRLGAHVAFGGEFTVPPELYWDGDALYVLAGEQAWHLYADRFGAALIPTKLGSRAKPNCTRVKTEHSRLLAHPHCQDMTSLTCAHEWQHTVAVCSAETCAVLIFSLPSTTPGGTP